MERIGSLKCRDCGLNASLSFFINKKTFTESTFVYPLHSFLPTKQGSQWMTARKTISDRNGSSSSRYFFRDKNERTSFTSQVRITKFCVALRKKLESTEAFE